jgi:hypothetical protein
MSRDSYSYDPQDTRDAAPHPPSRRGRGPTRDVREDRPAGTFKPSQQAGLREPQPPPLKPERLDSPRAYYDRDRTYLLRESELHSLAEIGKFRVISPVDLAKHGYGGDTARMERDIRRLKQESLLTDKTVEISQKKTLRVLTLTKNGHRLLTKTNRLAEDQPSYHGLLKPREVKHDAGLYRLYQKEAARIEHTGGRPVRVLLDYELKHHLNRDLANLRERKGDSETKQQIAERHGLHLVAGKVAVPDLRIEYETAEHEPRHIDLDLVTRDYRPRGLSEKAQAGFSLYSRAEDAAHLRRIVSDRELTAEILTL